MMPLNVSVNFSKMRLPQRTKATQGRYLYLFFSLAKEYTLIIHAACEARVDAWSKNLLLA